MHSYWNDYRGAAMKLRRYEKHRLWTVDELKILADMRKKEISMYEISKRLNRSKDSIRGKLDQMGDDIWDSKKWSRHISKRTFVYWTMEELREAKLVLDSGGSYKEAAAKVAHNERSLASKIYSMGMDFWEERNWERYVIG